MKKTERVRWKIVKAIAELRAQNNPSIAESCKNPVSRDALARRLGYSNASALTVPLKSLEEKGFVTWQPGKNNTLKLTEKGRYSVLIGKLLMEPAFVFHCKACKSAYCWRSPYLKHACQATPPEAMIFGEGIAHTTLNNEVVTLDPVLYVGATKF